MWKFCIRFFFLLIIKTFSTCSSTDSSFVDLFFNMKTLFLVIFEKKLSKHRKIQLSTKSQCSDVPVTIVITHLEHLETVQYSCSNFVAENFEDDAYFEHLRVAIKFYNFLSFKIIFRPLYAIRNIYARFNFLNDLLSSGHLIHLWPIENIVLTPDPFIPLGLVKPGTCMIKS